MTPAPGSLGGILPPVPTPFDRRDELDLPALEHLLATLEPDVDGFVVLGSNGEAAYLDEGERDAVVRAARATIPDGKPLVIGTGGESTRQTIDRTRRAADQGADLVLVLAPHYYRGQMRDDPLRRHFEAVAAASPVPVLLYDIPQATNLPLPPALTADLARHPNIVGLKDSSGNVGAMTEILRQVPEEFAMLTGNAPTLLPALSLGARGGILAVANVAPRACRAIADHVQRGDLAEARRLQKELNPLALAVTSRFGVPGLKAALGLLGLPAGTPRPPLLPVAEAELAVIARLVEQAGDWVLRG